MQLYNNNRRPSIPILPTLPPLYSPRSTPYSRDVEPPDSAPSTPTTPSTPAGFQYFPVHVANFDEPWNYSAPRFKSPRSTPRALTPGTTPPRSLPALPEPAHTVPRRPPIDSPSSVQPSPTLLNNHSHKLPAMSNSSSLKRKVVIMGSPSVGKTSLTQQYIAPPTYSESYFPTIEATSHKTVHYNGSDYECEIIDSAGQDEYTLFPSKYAVGVHGYLLVYSITSRQSFEMIQTVHDKILDFAGLEKVPCVVVGQKSDLGGERRVSTAEGQALAEKIHAGFIESSARDNKNVGKAFEVLLGEMQKEYNPAPEKKKSGWFSWGR